MNTTTTTSSDADNHNNQTNNTSQHATLEMLDFALEYAAKDWQVIPLHTPTESGHCTCSKIDCKSVGKHPRTMNGLKDATSDQTKIKQWWARWPDANIGVVTGDASGIVALDVDLDKSGNQSLVYLEDENSSLPETLESITGSGGSHYLFATPETPIKNSASRIAQGLDVRGNGGYIVAPPSLHKSGNRYEWKNDCGLAKMPDWLLQLVTQPSQSTGEFVNGECIPEGQRNNTLFRLACSMRSRGLDEPEILALLQAVNNHRCDPPLPESEVIIISKSSSRYDPENNFIQCSNAPVVESSKVENLGRSWNEFSKQAFPESEKILFELERGEVGMLVAATNVGKTTLAMNISLLGAIGESYFPLLSNENAIRVMYVDGETRQARLQRDIQRMVSEWSGELRTLVGENLNIVCDATLDGFPLNLSNKLHLLRLQQSAQQFRPDLIVLDTLASLFTLNAENDNAEMTKVVMKPLAGLAKETNSAVLLLHHVGKQSEESQARTKAYRGRGASALGAASRMSLLLTSHPSNNQCVILQCAKAKGGRFEDVVLRLNPESRWFEQTNESAPQESSTYKKVVTAIVNTGRIVQRKEVVGLTGIPSSTLTRILSKAVETRDLIKPKDGYYCAPDHDQTTATIDNDQVSNQTIEANEEVVN